MIRNPAVAGQFYSANKTELLKQLGSLVRRGPVTENAMAVILPHAGYVYSGGVAGKVLGCVNQKKTYIIIGPNHTGLGERFGIASSESWNTPLGRADVDMVLAKDIIAGSNYITFDDMSHQFEHSVEVQIPFLQYMQKSFKFIPMVASHASVDIYRSVGKEIAASIKRLKLENDVMLIASSDMTHYESQSEAKKKDDMAIKSILSLDEQKLIDTISKFDISMCGYAPVAIIISAAKELGAGSARLISYATSGDVSGDYSAVVGYAGITIY